MQWRARSWRGDLFHFHSIQKGRLHSLLQGPVESVLNVYDFRQAPTWGFSLCLRRDLWAIPEPSVKKGGHFSKNLIHRMLCWDAATDSSLIIHRVQKRQTRATLISCLQKQEWPARWQYGQMLVQSALLGISPLLLVCQYVQVQTCLYSFPSLWK